MSDTDTVACGLCKRAYPKVIKHCAFTQLKDGRWRMTSGSQIVHECPEEFANEERSHAALLVDGVMEATGGSS